MFQSVSECFTLSNGVKIPCVGYGTWQTPDGEIAASCVAQALKAGYRHIDTAFGYANEASVGEGLRRSGVPRDEVFITTKHWISERGYAKTIKTAEESLRLLGLDYLDLYLIHWPCVAKSSENWEEINADTWRGFERLYTDGKIRAIGVSNFLPPHLEALKKTAKVMPMVDQIEFHPGYTQEYLLAYLKANNILPEAWSPLGCGAVVNDERLINMAAKYNKNVGQLCIRFALERGVLPLPKSTNPGRIAGNTDVFNFELSADDIAYLSCMPQFGYSGFYAEEAPADAYL